jgi:hypothetical protein
MDSVYMTEVTLTEKNYKCVREVSNFASVQLHDRFDSPKFNPEEFMKGIYIKSPKMVALLNNIRKIDRKDYWLTGKLHKHFIFTDLKKGSAKVIAAAFIAAGYTPVFEKRGNKIVISQEALSKKSDSKFALLSSTALWKTPVTPQTTKETLETFNKRPDNVYGKDVRFIILDSGFKEGIDLFDVRYCHLFEEPETEADGIQAMGRALRYCGQKGLPYKKWTVDVFTYTINDITPIVSDKARQIETIDKLIQKNAVDALLNGASCKENKMTISWKPIVIGLSALIALSSAALVAYKRSKRKN